MRGSALLWIFCKLVSVRKRSFSAVAASICRLACAAYRCTSQHRLGNCVHPEFPDEHKLIEMMPFDDEWHLYDELIHHQKTVVFRGGSHDFMVAMIVFIAFFAEGRICLLEKPI